jgi:hypothetical protein
MKLRSLAKRILERFDPISPYPLYYPFRMSDSEKAVFDEAIRGARHYLEYGLGGSTIRAILKSKAVIYSVESSPEWISHMRKYILIRSSETRRLHIHPVDIGPVGEWGYPESEDCSESFEAYSSGIFKFLDSALIDLVLIDGRFRVACTLRVILACHGNSGIKILIHDFWDRPEYHILLKYLDMIAQADTIGLFSIKENVDLVSAGSDYEAYKLIPR